MVSLCYKRQYKHANLAEIRAEVTFLRKWSRRFRVGSRNGVNLVVVVVVGGGGGGAWWLECVNT